MRRSLLFNDRSGFLFNARSGYLLLLFLGQFEFFEEIGVITLFALLLNGIVLEMDVKRCVSQMLLLHKNRHFLGNYFARNEIRSSGKIVVSNGVAFYGKFGTFSRNISTYKSQSLSHTHRIRYLNIEMDHF